MDNALIDVSIRTMVGNLPGIINENNKYITEEFDKIVNNNKYVLDVSSNNINATNGIFRNLTVDGFSVNSLSIKNYADVDSKISGVDLTTFMNSAVNTELDMKNGSLNSINITDDNFYKFRFYIKSGSLFIPLQIGISSDSSYVLYYDQFTVSGSTAVVKRIFSTARFTTTTKLKKISKGEVTL